MIPHDLGGLRPLNTPRRLAVSTQPDPLLVQTGPDRLRPVALRWRGRRVAVTAILDLWRIDDEWWRDEISRIYYAVTLATGAMITIFHDLISDQWYEQRAGMPRADAPPVAIATRLGRDDRDERRDDRDERRDDRDERRDDRDERRDDRDDDIAWAG